MDRPENAGKRVLVRWILFQFDQLAIEQVQVLATFDQEISNDLIGHSSNPRPTPLATRLYCSVLLLPIPQFKSFTSATDRPSVTLLLLFRYSPLHILFQHVFRFA
jgi:hypothetical protein